jgi:hypothetical protein
VRHVRFDDQLRGVPSGEDVDFCARLGAGTLLVIAPRARLKHDPSPIGRVKNHWIKEYVQGKLYVYHRNWRHSLKNRLYCAWFSVGCLTIAMFASLKHRSLGPSRDYLSGRREAARLGASCPIRSHGT